MITEFLQKKSCPKAASIKTILTFINPGEAIIKNKPKILYN